MLKSEKYFMLDFVHFLETESPDFASLWFAMSQLTASNIENVSREAILRQIGLFEVGKCTKKPYFLRFCRRSERAEPKSEKNFTEMLAEGGMEKSVLAGLLPTDTQIVIITRLFQRPVRRIPLE